MRYYPRPPPPTQLCAFDCQLRLEQDARRDIEAKLRTTTEKAQANCDAYRRETGRFEREKKALCETVQQLANSLHHVLVDRSGLSDDEKRAQKQVDSLTFVGQKQRCEQLQGECVHYQQECERHRRESVAYQQECEQHRRESVQYQLESVQYQQECERLKQNEQSRVPMKRKR